MAIPLHKDITTLNAVHDTILSDHYAYRWFTYLIVQKNIFDSLRDSSTAREGYQRMRRLTRFQAAIILVFFLGLIVYSAQLLILFFSITAILIYLYVRTLTEKRKVVAQLGLELVKKDFGEATVGKKTLYQIAEFYSTRVKIPSLVDVVYQFDQIRRNTAVLILITIVLIYPMRLGWDALGLGFFIYFAVVNIVNLNFLYRHLK